MKKSFEKLMTIADRLAAGQGVLRDTILKEVLHTDILMALHDSGFANSLVFQGGTALRLCYGNERYSEDLDFVRSTPLEPTHFETFKEALKASMSERHGLNVRIADSKQPLDERTTEHSVVVHRWTAVVEIERPGARNQRINIEVADVPAYDARPRMISSPYPQYSANSVMLNVSSEKEILADKVVAVAGRNYIKARDLWDIKWLRDKGVELNHDWVCRKAADYHLDGGQLKGDQLQDTQLKGSQSRGSVDMSPFVERLKTRISDLALPETRKKFVDEMSRFLAQDQAKQWLSDEATSTGLLMDVGDFLGDQLPRLVATAIKNP